MTESAGNQARIDSHAPEGAPRSAFAGLALAAIGVVFGDIGTSPLYTLNTVFDPTNGLPLNAANVLGVVSLILWSLLIVVSLKYVTLIMRANNHGEGGIMALLAMAAGSVADRPKLKRRLLIAGVFGAALFYGDGVITPAISVLSAVEGMEIVAPHLKTYVIPVALAVLIGLFLVQRRGTAGIGAVFGPVMVLWFAIIAVIGFIGIQRSPAVLAALNPLVGLSFLNAHGWLAFVALGGVVLALTGAEALYADMGHFGCRPIRASWFSLVFPALGLNYLGQGALLLTDPKSIDNPFYHLFPAWSLIPMIVLATVATVIASQAVISGAYSMTKQAIQLGFLPRLTVLHTSAKQIGQVYVPVINWALLAAVVASVVGFGSSSALGSAYGIAVTGTMLVTTFLTFYVVRYAWHYNWLLCVLATGFFFIIDAVFFSANLLKFLQGGWYPLVVGTAAFIVMTTWGRGRELLLAEARVRSGVLPLKEYLHALLADPPVRVAGTAVFLTIDIDTVPHALMDNLEHNRVLHERLVFVSVTSRTIPLVPPEQRVTVASLDSNCWSVVVAYGFKDDIDLPLALGACAAQGLPIDAAKVSYFLSHALVVPVPGKGMSLWRAKLFTAMSHNITNAGGYFRLPPNRAIELGSMIEI
jgi:KUP system potassium uptake protein